MSSALSLPNKFAFPCGKVERMGEIETCEKGGEVFVVYIAVHNQNLTLLLLKLVQDNVHLVAQVKDKSS